MFNEKAEKLNGRAAMVGFVAAVGSILQQVKSSQVVVSDMLVIAAHDRRVYLCGPID